MGWGGGAELAAGDALLRDSAVQRLKLGGVVPQPAVSHQPLRVCAFPQENFPGFGLRGAHFFVNGRALAVQHASDPPRNMEFAAVTATGVVSLILAKMRCVWRGACVSCSYNDPHVSLAGASGGTGGMDTGRRAGNRLAEDSSTSSPTDSPLRIVDSKRVD